MASSSAAAFGLLGRIPVPLFGTARVAANYGKRFSTHLPEYAKAWSFPLAVGAVWFVWPAVDDEWKISVGLLADPEASSSPPPAPEPVKLDDAAQKAVAVAHKGHELTAEEKKVMKQVAAGDYTALETDWNEFMTKSSKPGEDDDDDDEDEDEDDEDEDEEEEDDE